MTDIDRDKFFAELEELGEEEVRIRYTSARVYGAGKANLVKAWLNKKDQERAASEEARNDDSNREQINIARSAKNAAWAAAIAAIIAAICAIIAILSSD